MGFYRFQFGGIAVSLFLAADTPVFASCFASQTCGDNPSVTCFGDDSCNANTTGGGSVSCVNNGVKTTTYCKKSGVVVIGMEEGGS